MGSSMKLNCICVFCHHHRIFNLQKVTQIPVEMKIKRKLYMYHFCISICIVSSVYSAEITSKIVLVSRNNKSIQRLGASSTHEFQNMEVKFSSPSPVSPL